MRLIKNIYGEKSPLILHDRLWPLRSLHIKVRFTRQAILRQPRTLPAYCLPKMPADQEARLHRACENFIGARGSSDPAVALRYKVRAIEGLLQSPTVSEQRKQELQVALAELCG